MSKSLRIGMVSCYFPPSIGGVQTHIAEISASLKRRGYEVKGLTTVPETSLIDDSMEITRIAAPRTLKRTVPVPRPLRMIEVARAARRLSRTCDLVHVHSSKRMFTVIVELVAQLSSVPVVLTVHGGGIVDLPDLSTHRRISHKVNRRLLLRLADIVVSTCPYFTDVATRYIPRSKIRSIPNGIDTDFFTPGLADKGDLDVLDSLSPDANVLLSVNMIKRVKGMQYVVQALPEVLETYPETHYVIVGDGSWKTVLEDFAEERGVRDHLHFAGAIFDEEIVREYLRAADMALIPSSGEATSISTLEAMATECPVVATPVGGIDDLLGDNERGRVAELFPPGSYMRKGPKTLPPEKIHLLANQIEWVLDNPGKADQMAQAGRTYVLENYAWPAIVDQLEDVYAELVDTGP
jgi:glycosyltransferase involved in cell wall biosynthesis